MIQPSFATMLCFVQTDAALERRDGRPAARRHASSARSTASRVDGQLSTNDTALLMCQRRERRGDRARVRGRAALRPGARRAAAPARARRSSRDGEGAARVGRVVVTRRRRRRGRARRARRRELAAREGRAQRRRPELGPDRAGRRRRAARHRAARARHRDRGRAGLRPRRGGPLRRCRRSRERVARDEVEYVVGLPGEGHETEVFFSDLSHGYVTINADYTT